MTDLTGRGTVAIQGSHPTRCLKTPPGRVQALVLGFTVPTAAAAEDLPRMNKALSAERRSDLLIDAMNLDQKIQQIAMKPVANTNIPNCAFSAQGRHVEGIPELAIPTLRMTNGRSATATDSWPPPPRVWRAP